MQFNIAIPRKTISAYIYTYKLIYERNFRYNIQDFEGIIY